MTLFTNCPFLINPFFPLKISHCFQLPSVLTFTLWNWEAKNCSSRKRKKKCWDNNKNLQRKKIIWKMEKWLNDGIWMSLGGKKKSGAVIRISRSIVIERRSFFFVNQQFHIQEVFSYFFSFSSENFFIMIKVLLMNFEKNKKKSSHSKQPRREEAIGFSSLFFYSDAKVFNLFSNWKLLHTQFSIVGTKQKKKNEKWNRQKQNPKAFNFFIKNLFVFFSNF